MLNFEGRAHLENTVGGAKGHIFRRFIHIGMIIFPVIYFWYGMQISEVLENLLEMSITREKILMFVLILFFVVEVTRLSFGITIFGQRTYEKKQISALAWGGFSLCLCLLIAPKGGYMDSYIAFPIIITISLIDPFLGEARKLLTSTKLIISLGLILTLLIWVLCSVFLGTPFWLAFIMSPLAILSEWPSLKYIDDNATMILIPLFASILLMPLYA